MGKANSLRDVPRTGSPDHGVLERVLQRPVHLITHILDRRLVPYDECFAKVRLLPFSLGVDPHQLQFLPASIDDILDSQVELAAHDDCVRLASQLVQEVQRDRVDLVVDIQAALAQY